MLQGFTIPHYSEEYNALSFRNAQGPCAQLNKKHALPASITASTETNIARRLWPVKGGPPTFFFFFQFSSHSSQAEMHSLGFFSWTSVKCLCNSLAFSQKLGSVLGQVASSIKNSKLWNPQLHYLKGLVCLFGLQIMTFRQKTIWIGSLGAQSGWSREACEDAK